MSERPPHVAAAGHYDRGSQAYDDDANVTRELNARILRERALEIKARDVLELGCGTGKNSEWLALYARQLLCLDMSAEKLAKAEARLAEVRHVSFLQHDVRQPWPVEEASRDRVVSNLVLEHVQDLRPVLVQVARVLRSDGLFFMSELHPFRQIQGAQAQFGRTEGAQLQAVPSFWHDVSDYVAAGLAAGLVLRGLDEWRDAEVPQSVPPRLLALLWLKPA
jgi:ubiquinone/menaquinone biosynthesis C-methylase UbiE